jgi:hypothetical protein
MNLQSEYYDINPLFYLFRVFPFGKGEIVEFNLVMDGRNGSPVGIFKMQAQELGREAVIVSGKTCDCFKLGMGVRGEYLSL